MDYFVLNEHREPVPADRDTAWRFKMTESNWRVGLDERGGVTVSTVFMIMNHALDDGPPVVFETIVMGGEHDSDIERYRTWAEAVDGHAATCARVFGRLH